MTSELLRTESAAPVRAHPEQLVFRLTPVTDHVMLRVAILCATCSPPSLFLLILQFDAPSTTPNAQRNNLPIIPKARVTKLAP